MSSFPRKTFAFIVAMRLLDQPVVGQALNQTDAVMLLPLFGIECVQTAL
jgi:hypothetical protein